jgi:hypothetical protein
MPRTIDTQNRRAAIASPEQRCESALFNGSVHQNELIARRGSARQLNLAIELIRPKPWHRSKGFAWFTGKIS